MIENQPMNLKLSTRMEYDEPYLRKWETSNGWSTVSRINEMRGDIQAESSGWLFKSSRAGSQAHIVAAPSGYVNTKHLLFIYPTPSIGHTTYYRASACTPYRT